MFKRPKKLNFSLINVICLVSLTWNGKKETKEKVENIFQEPSESFEENEIHEDPIIEGFGERSEISKNIQDKGLMGSRDESSWYNMLFLGDNMALLRGLWDEFPNQIQLIYFDPPFGTGSDFDFNLRIGEGKYSKGSKYWIRKTAYADSWEGGIDAYLDFMYARFLLMKELLADNGSIYVHLDWHAIHYIKLLMDEVFGKENFHNQIIWFYPAASANTRNFFMRSHDVILFYSKSSNYVFNDDPNIYMEYSNRVMDNLKKDELGTFYYRGGSHDGKKLKRKVYVDGKGIFPRDVWLDVPYVRANTPEYQGFSTQKPERLLKRIILSSSNQDDIVADFFCGTGTTLAVAEKLGRRWIGCDVHDHAIHITRKRLLSIQFSNDLINWNVKFSQFAQPFKILQQKHHDKNDFFLKKLLKSSETISEVEQEWEKPIFEIKVNEKKKLSLKLELINYSLPYKQKVIDEISEKINAWSDWIDYWAIDFDHDKSCFKSSWTSFRTQKKRELSLVSDWWNYPEPGNYMICIKVKNILGNETNQILDVKVN